MMFKDLIGFNTYSFLDEIKNPKYILTHIFKLLNK